MPPLLMLLMRELLIVFAVFAAIVCHAYQIYAPPYARALLPAAAVSAPPLVIFAAASRLIYRRQRHDDVDALMICLPSFAPCWQHAIDSDSQRLLMPYVTMPLRAFFAAILMDAD